MKLTKKRNQYIDKGQSESDSSKSSEDESESSESIKRQRPQRSSQKNQQKIKPKPNIPAYAVASSSQDSSYVMKEESKHRSHYSKKSTSRREDVRQPDYDYNKMYVDFVQSSREFPTNRDDQNSRPSKKHSSRKHTQQFDSSDQEEEENLSGSDSEDYRAQRKKSRSSRVQHHQMQQPPYKKQQPKQNFDQFMQDFYPQRQNQRLPIASQFEPQYIKTQRRTKQRSQPIIEEYPEENWVPKPTKEGFLYFHLEGTKTFQWNFPRYYDPKLKKTRPFFIDHWVKKYDGRGKKYWQNTETKHIQHTKPDQETYLIQASIVGNLAFIELYIKCKGDLTIMDQQRRTALHHAVSSGHKEITALLCEFGKKYDLIESEDTNGCTPLFMAIRKNGDTCLHVASAYNSLDAMVVVSNYGGFELLLKKNRQGLRPIEVASKMRNYECFESLQKLERNLQFQNALIEREIDNLDKVTKKKKRKTSKIAPIKSQKSKMATQRLKSIREQSSEEESQEGSQDEDMNYLGGRQHQRKKMREIENEMKASEHERRYMDKVKNERRLNKKTKEPNIVPFSEYRDQPERYRSKSKSQRVKIMPAQMESEEDSQEERDEVYDNPLGKIRGGGDNSRANQSAFKLSIRDDSVLHNNSKLRQLKSARDAFLVRGPGQLSDEDDEEAQQSRKRPKSERRRANDDEEDTKESLIEKAYDKTTTLVKSIGGIFKQGLNSIRGYVFQNTEEAKTTRSKSKKKRDLSSGSSEYETARGGRKSQTRSKSARNRHGNQIVPYNDYQNRRSSSEEEISRKKQKRSNKIAPIRQYKDEREQQQNVMVLDQLRMEDQYEQNDQAPPYMMVQNDNSQNKSKGSQNKSQKMNISIQADPPAQNEVQIQAQALQKQIKPRQKRESHTSLKSIGVGSINVNESVHTQSQYSSQKSQMAKEHSRMIQKEKKKRLGNKSKQLIQKNYQSSEDERATNQGTADVKNPYTQRSPSPAPRFMKEEIAYYKQLEEAQKFQNAFYQKDVKQEFEQQQLSANKQPSGFQTPQSQQTPTQQQPPVVFSSQRQILKTSTQNFVPNNQRYVRQQSTSLSEREGANINTVANESPNTKFQRSQSSQNNLQSQSGRAPTLLTQEQFDMIMLNSEEETKRMPKNNNNQYRITEQQEVIPSQQQQQLNSTPKQHQSNSKKQEKNEDIQQFYEDLMKQAEITQINAQEPKQNISESNIDDTNLSNLYQKIMFQKGQKQQQQQSDKKLNELAQQLSEEQKSNHKTENEEEKQIEFDPAENKSDPENQNYFRFDNQSLTMIKSVLNELDDFQNISECSFMKPEGEMLGPQQSNILDKGQFVQTSCISIYQQNQQNNSHLGRNVFGQQNNSMHYNVNYQSDAESDFKKKPILNKLFPRGSINEQSPLKKQLPLIPPLSQKNLYVQNFFTESENSNSVRIVSKDGSNSHQNQVPSQQVQSISDQKQIIDLFKEDAEVQLLQENKQEVGQSLADELNLETFNFMEEENKEENKQEDKVTYLHKQRGSDEVNDNMVILESFDAEGYERQMEKQQVNLKESIKQKINEYEQQYNQEPEHFSQSPKRSSKIGGTDNIFSNAAQVSKGSSNLLQMDDSRGNQQKQQKRNTRYGDLEDSLINFDLTTSKLDQTERILENKQASRKFTETVDDLAVEDVESSENNQRQSLKSKVKNQIQNYVSSQTSSFKSNTNLRPIMESETLPLQKLRPAYVQSEIQTWQEESHTLMDQSVFKQNIMGNMMVQAFSNTSNPKKLNRKYIPYNSQRSATIVNLDENNALGSGNATHHKKQKSNQREDRYSSKDSPKSKMSQNYKETELLRKSNTYNVNNVSSQDSILQDLDSISRIYNELETVQEEEKDITHTQEESKIQIDVRKSTRVIPKEQYEFEFQEKQEDKPSTVDEVKQIFYHQEGLQYINNQDLHYNPGQQSENEDNQNPLAPNYWKWKRDERQNRSTATNFLYNMHTSSEDEQKKKPTSIFANARPKKLAGNRLLTSSVNAPLYNQVKQQKTIKDISFKSNVSVHTDASERLRENLEKIQKTKLLNRKSSKDKDSNKDKLSQN